MEQVAAKARDESGRQLELGAEAQRIASGLARPDARIYWVDLAATATVLYGGLATAILATGGLAWFGAAACGLALYRAISFIHELTHLRPGDAPGFRLGWNALIGVPFLAPSLLYEGVHNLHHLRQIYGTADDPEYLPLARRRPALIIAFLAAAALAPVGAFVRFAVLAPLSLAISPLRGAVLRRYSAMSINPAFQRKDLAAAARPAWRAQEISAWLWSWALLALICSGGLAARAVLTGFLVMSAVAVVNQLRTLVAHAWTSDGAPMSLAEQYLDSINVPPPALLPVLWAPVGLRYHALHHLLPGVPYHNLAEAHRRLVAALPAHSDYHRAARKGLLAPLSALIASAAGATRAGRQARA